MSAWLALPRWSGRLIRFLIHQQSFALLLHDSFDRSRHEAEHRRQLQSDTQAVVFRIDRAGNFDAHGRDGQRQLILARPAVGDGGSGPRNMGSQLAYACLHAAPCFATAKIVRNVDDRWCCHDCSTRLRLDSSVKSYGSRTPLRTIWRRHDVRLHSFDIVGGGTKRHRSGAGKKSTCLEKFGFCDEWLAARLGIKKYSKGAH